MSTLVIPYPSFEPNTTIVSAQVNANFAAIATTVNGNLDSTNISSLNASKVNAGSFASGAYTFPGSLTVTGTLTIGSLGSPLAIAYGGTGTATPGLIAGANISITGPWPNQTISASGGGGGTVTAVTASAPLSSSGGTAPNITIPNPLTVVYGGTGKTTALQVKLAIALGFVSGTVTTGADLPAQPVVAYTGGSLTGIRINCKTADTSTVITVYKNGTSIGTITNTSSQPVYTAITAVAIAAGDVLSAAVTTAGTAADVAIVVEGVQNAF